MERGRSLTIDALAAARVAESLQIREILSLRTGKLLDVRQFLSRQTHERIVRVRNTILEHMLADAPRVVCPLCRVPVYLVATPEKAFFFRHRSEDGSCPSVTRGSLTEEEIRERKYAGIQESDPHKRLKALLLRSIGADANFEAASAEKTWRSEQPGGPYRRPDVSCSFNGVRLAFEAQLTTTFLSVIVGRRLFYQSEGGLLVWFLANFDPAQRRLTEDDILFHNNSNVLVVDEETTVASEQAGKFLVRCWYRHPGERGSSGEAIWASRTAAFAELTLDLSGQRAFLVDVEGEEARRRAEILARRAQEEEAFDTSLRADAIAFFSEPPYERGSWNDQTSRWDDLRERLQRRGVRLPSNYSSSEDTDRSVRLALSARDGRPVGYRFQGLIQLAHHLYDQQPALLMMFGLLLRQYGREDELKRQDGKGRWSAKSGAFRAAVKAKDPRYYPDLASRELIEYLLPETKPALEKLESAARRFE